MEDVKVWNSIIPFTHGLDLYMILSLFFFYSFFGWLVESIYMSYCNKQITNRGFIHGPFCPIYGVGALFIYSVLYPFSNNFIVLYFVGTFLATSIEFITAIFMVKIFGFVWWDYTNKSYNYRGVLCLESTIAWGFYIVFQFLFLHKTMVFAVYSIPVTVGKLIIISLFIYFVLDFSYCIRLVKKGGVTAEENNLLAITPNQN